MIGQGFSIPGTVSSEFGKKELHSWRQGFYDRLTAHAERAAATLATATPAAADTAVVVASSPAVAAATEVTANGTPAAGGGAERELAAAVDIEIDDGYPRVIAFAGKRQVRPLLLYIGS